MIIQIRYEYEIDPVVEITPTGPEKTKEKFIIIDFNEMKIDDKSLTSLNKEFIKSMKILILIVILIYQTFGVSMKRNFLFLVK